MRTSPPAWAEGALRLFIRREVFLTVSGDLLEQYRDSILPACGAVRADGWYLKQVLGFVLRAMVPWAALFSAAFVAGWAMDAFYPAAPSPLKSAVGVTIVTVLIVAGFRAAWRSESFLAGVAAGLVTAACASPLSMGSLAVLLGFSHASGLLAVAVIMSVRVIGFATLISGVAGLAGAGLRRALH